MPASAGEGGPMATRRMRKIVGINEDKCDGCGLCIPACAEGALAIVDGKARLVSEVYCDGLGACLGECPQGAITIEEREADVFDEDAVKERLASPSEQHVESHADEDSGFVCPSARSMSFVPCAQASPADLPERETSASALSHWPVQLMLVPPNASYMQGAELLVAADCVPFAYARFHSDLLAGKVVVVGCPKQEDRGFYKERLTQVLRDSGIRKVTVAHMEVPCCSGLVMAAREALAASGKEVPFEEITITVRGQRVDQSERTALP
jgi:ferredoxin